MSTVSIFPSFLSLLCICLQLHPTNSKLVASSSQRLVAVGDAYQAVCHYNTPDTERYLYWTAHYNQDKHNDAEPQHNFGGIDIKSCLAFSFDTSNSEFAFNTSLFGLTGQITCDLDGGSMGLRIENVQPEYNGISFSCTAGINTSTRSNKVTVLMGNSKLVTLEIDMTAKGIMNDTSDEEGAALGATCRVDRGLQPQLLVWASVDIYRVRNETTFGGMITDICFRYKNIGSDQYGNVSFSCNREPSTFSSTLKAESLPAGTVVFCYVILDEGSTGTGRIVESNRLAVSKRGRFTKLYLSVNDSITIGGDPYFARCRGFDIGDMLVGFCNRVRWRGLRKFGQRARVSCNEEENESVLVIQPTRAMDSQNEIFCKVDAEESERVKISVAQKKPNPPVLLLNESTTGPIPLNGTFRAVCSFKETNVQEIYWIVTEDNVQVGRVDILGNTCRSHTMIKEKETMERVSISCDLHYRKTTFSVQFAKAGDTGTKIYCATTDQLGMAIRSDSLILKTQGDSRNKDLIIKSRPAYRRATLVTTCDYDGDSELLFLIHPAGENINNGSEAVTTGNRTFILVDRNCSVIDYAFYLDRRFFVECDQKNLSVNLIIDPVDVNDSGASEVSCISYGYISSTTSTFAAPEKRIVSLKHQIWRLVYPVTIPVLKYSGDQFVINETQSGNLSKAWIVPALPGQEMEFSCVAENPQHLMFNLSLYIQTEEGFAFEIQDQRKKLNLTSSTYKTSATIRIKSTFKGIFCVAENVVSRWESDLASFKLRNASVFIGVPGKGALLESVFLMSQKIPTLKLCFKFCEINVHCLGVSYRNKLCSLSKFGMLDVEFERGKIFYFYHRLQARYLLERNDFRPDFYTKHENRTLLVDHYLYRVEGMTVSECERFCSRVLPCQSIVFKRSQNTCFLSELMPILREGTTAMTMYDRDIYTRSYTPGSFAVLQNCSLNVEIKPVSVHSLFCSGNIERREVQCVEYCRNRNDCVAFSIKQEENGIHCYWHSVNIPELPLKKFGPDHSVYVRVRNLNDVLIPVAPFQFIPIA